MLSFIPSLPSLPRPSSAKCSPRCTLAPPTPSTPCITPLESHALPNYPDWRYIGPPPSAGPLPTVLYLALTADQSLTLSPFNSLIPPLLSHSIRILSVSLPYHSTMQVNETVFNQWAEVYNNGGDPVSNFVRRVSTSIQQMQNENLILSSQFAIAGLSRGALLATLIASKVDVTACLGFAPVTSLIDLHEFDHVKGRAREKVERASLDRDDILDGLVNVPTRFYMGNFDTRVGTRNAFHVVAKLAERAVRRGIRSPPHEFVMYCSVGKQGHGTPPDVFEAGANFLINRLN